MKRREPYTETFNWKQKYFKMYFATQ